MATKKSAAKKPAAKKIEKPALSEEQNQMGIPELQTTCEELWAKIANSEKEEKATLTLQYNILAAKCNDLAGFQMLNVIDSSTIMASVMPEPNDAPAGKLQPSPTPPPKSKANKASACTDTAGTAAAQLKPDRKVDDLIKFVFAGGKVDGIIKEFTKPDKSTFRVKGSDGCLYHVKECDVLLKGETVVQCLQRAGRITVGNADQATKASKDKVTSEKKASIKPSSAPAKSKRTELQVMKKTPAIEKILNSDMSGADMIRQVFDLVTGWDEKSGKCKNRKAFDVEDFILMSGINRSRIVGCLDKFRPEK